jgi:DNA-binding LytR/AlgR family response regulator
MPEAFKYKTSAYIIKPVDSEKLAQAFNTALEHLSFGGVFCISVKGAEITVPYDDITYFENNLKNVILHTAEGAEPFVFIGTLDKIPVPQEYFHLCHKSFLVNFLHVRQLDKSKHEFVLNDGCRIPISRSCYTRTVAEFTHFHSKDRGAAL